MKPYAIFLSLTDNYVYLFNALYNSAELFNVGDYAEFVVMYDNLPQGYIDFMMRKTETLKTKIRFVKIECQPEDANIGKVMTVKFYRYKIMAELGREYKSICFIDSDIFLCSGIKEYFDIAASTDLIVATNDNVVRHYKNQSDQGTCPAYHDTKTPVFSNHLFDGKFHCNVPTFLDSNKYHDVLMDVFNHRLKMGMDNTWPFTGDLETMNIVFLKHKVKDRMLILPSHLWTGVHYSIYRISTAVRRWNVPKNSELSDSSYNRRFLFMSETCEHVRAFHGRDWTSDKSEEALKQRNIPKLLTQMEVKFEGQELEKATKKRESIFDTIQAYFLYLQFESYVSLEDVNTLCPVRGIEYLRNKKVVLENIIRTYRAES